MLTNSMQYSVLLSKKYELIIPAEIYAQMRLIVDEIETEIQWFQEISSEVIGNVVKITLSDIHIPEQAMGSTTVESSASEIANYWMDYMKKHSESPEKTGQRVASTRVWAHSHVNMAAHPSGTDINQWASFIRDTRDQGISMMLILNRKGEIYSRLYDPALGVEVVGLPIHYSSYQSDTIRSRLTEILEKQKAKRDTLTDAVFDYKAIRPIESKHPQAESTMLEKEAVSIFRELGPEGKSLKEAWDMTYFSNFDEIRIGSELLNYNEDEPLPFNKSSAFKMSGPAALKNFFIKLYQAEAEYSIEATTLLSLVEEAAISLTELHKKRSPHFKKEFIKEKTAISETLDGYKTRGTEIWQS